MGVTEDRDMKEAGKGLETAQETLSLSLSRTLQTITPVFFGGDHSRGFCKDQSVGFGFTRARASQTRTQRAQYPLLKEYGLKYIRLHIMI